MDCQIYKSWATSCRLFLCFPFDINELLQAVAKVVRAHPQVVADYKAGKVNAIKFLMGAVMRETKSRANPLAVERLILNNL